MTCVSRCHWSECTTVFGHLLQCFITCGLWRDEFLCTDRLEFTKTKTTPCICLSCSLTLSPCFSHFILVKFVGFSNIHMWMLSWPILGPAADFMKTYNPLLYGLSIRISKLHHFQSENTWVQRMEQWQILAFSRLFISCCIKIFLRKVKVKIGTKKGWKVEVNFLSKRTHTSIHTHIQLVFWRLYLTYHPSSHPAIIVLPNTWSQNSLRHAIKAGTQKNIPKSDTFPPTGMWKFH